MGFGSFLSGVGGVLGALSGRDADDDNARLSSEQAERERERTRIELQRHRRNVRRVLGEQRAQFVAAGIRGDSGSALDIIADTTAEAETDERLIEAGGEARESFHESRARQFRRSGRDVFAGGLLSAAAEFDDI